MLISFRSSEGSGPDGKHLVAVRIAVDREVKFISYGLVQKLHSKRCLEVQYSVVRVGLPLTENGVGDVLVLQIVMKGGNIVEEVKQKLGKYLNEILYMPVIQIDATDGIRKIKEFEEALKPVAFELVFASDTCKAPKVAREMLKGKSRIWYNTLWDTLAGGYDDKSLEDPDAGYGFLIDQLGATMIQTDRTAFLLEYLKSRGLHP